MKFSDETKQGLSALVDTAVQGGAAIPGAAVVVVGKDGSELFARAAGTRGAASDEPMTLDSIFWVASCTKMVAGLACMQLVEKGVLKLDDSAQTEGFCPEWQHLKVLAPNGDLVDRTKHITLRMLLTHTAGFGYAFFNERLRDYSLPVGINEFSGDIRDFTQPLLFQPGEGWEYGVSQDGKSQREKASWRKRGRRGRTRSFLKLIAPFVFRQVSIGPAWFSKEPQACPSTSTSRPTSASPWASRSSGSF